MYKKEIIQVIILFIILFGIVSYTIVDHSGISQNRARGLVTHYVQEEYNISADEIYINNASSNADNMFENFFKKLSGNKVYKIRALFQIDNTTYNMSYFVNANTGSIKINQPESNVNKHN